MSSLGIAEGMRLAAAPTDGADRGRFDQPRRKRDTSFRQLARPVVQLERVPNGLDIALHVLRRPASRMTDERELRDVKAQLAEKVKELACNALNIVLPANDDESGHFVLDQYPIANRDLILNAVEPFGHFEIERRWRCGFASNIDHH